MSFYIYSSIRHIRQSTIWYGKWELASDLNGARRPFPIIPTIQKPDIFLWNYEEKMLELVELTVPFEANIDEACERKTVRYEDLVKDCCFEGWKTWHSPIEVGCRGFVGFRLRKWFLKTGFTEKHTKNILKRIQETAEKASHWIWIKRDDASWFD